MSDTAKRDYGVSLDPESLDAQDVAVGTDGDGAMRYTASLLGQVDEHWRKAFRFVQLNATGFYRYRLIPDHPAVSFQCRQSDGMSDVAAVLARLKSFVELVNRTASSGSFDE